MRLLWVLQDTTLRIVLALAAFAGVAIGLTIPFLTLTARDRGVSLTAIGIMASSYMVTQMLLQLPMGAFSDRVGRAIPIALGLTIEAVGVAGFVIADSAWAFILLRVIQGAGVAILYPAMRALIADITPADRRGQAYAGFGAAFSSGLLFGPLIGGTLATTVGVNPLFLSAAAVQLGVATSALAFLRGKGRPGQVAPAGEQVPFRALLVAPLIGAFILAFGSQFQMGLFSGIWSIYLADLGAGDMAIGMSFSAYSIAYLLVAPFGGRLADSGQRWRRILAANVALAAVIIAYGFMAAIPVILLFGLIEGAIGTVAQPALDAYLATAADPRVQGRVQGAFSTVGMAGAAISALLGATLYEHGRIWPFLTAGLVLVVLTLVAVPLIRQAERQAGSALRPAPDAPGGELVASVAGLPGEPKVEV